MIESQTTSHTMIHVMGVRTCQKGDAEQAKRLPGLTCQLRHIASRDMARRESQARRCAKGGERLHGSGRVPACKTLWAGYGQQRVAATRAKIAGLSPRRCCASTGFAPCRMGTASSEDGRFGRDAVLVWFRLGHTGRGGAPRAAGYGRCSAGSERAEQRILATILATILTTRREGARAFCHARPPHPRR